MLQVQRTLDIVAVMHDHYRGWYLEVVVIFNIVNRDDVSTGELDTRLATKTISVVLLACCAHLAFGDSDTWLTA